MLRRFSLQGAVRPIRRALVAWRMAAVAACALSAPGAAQSAPGEEVVNVASVSYRDANGNAASASASAVVNVDRRRSAALDLVPPREAIAAPGTSHVFVHTLTNRGSERDLARLAVSATAGWAAELWLDADGDGQLTSADARVSQVELNPNEGAQLLVRVTVPAAALPGDEAIVAVRATSDRDASVSATVTDRLVVARVELFLSKQASGPEAAAGDTVSYTLVARNLGGAPSQALTLTDTLPAGTTYAGPTLVDGAARPASVTRAANGREVVELPLGPLAAGAGVTITFRVLIGDGAADVSRNVAQIRSADGSATSGPADVRLAATPLFVRKDLVGDSVVYLGDTVAYRLTYGHRGLARVRGLVLTDTLPAGLEFLRSTGAEVEGRVVRWRRPELGPLDSASVVLVARVVPPAAPGSRLVNVAAVEASNARASAARAAAVSVIAGEALTLRKSAQVLQVGIGEAVPYVLAVQNRTSRALQRVVIEDRLPAGMTLVGTPAGVDSAASANGVLRFFLRGALAVGETREVRYAALLASATRRAELRNVAVATAEGGFVRSDSATATVRARGAEAQGRTLVGKVFLDADGDGRQDAAERGVAGVRVWGADGEVVTTDVEGRFSFRDVLPGTHALRLDTLALPGGARAARAGDLVQVIRTDGWTLPRVQFALRPPAAGMSRDTAAVAQQGAPRPVTASTAADSAPVRVAPLRSAADREAEASRAFVGGPVVRIFSPADGTVLHTNRVYVGVRGEAGMPVKLYDGDRVIAEATLRPDGVEDFVGVEVAPGAHRVRVWMRNSQGAERWDSVAVHHAARAHAIIAPDAAVTMRTDDTATVRVRVVDAHGVPVGAGTQVTATVSGAALDGADSDPAQVGAQRAVGQGGWVTFALRGGRNPGPGRLRLASAGVERVVELRTLPTVHALIAVGAAQIALAGAGRSFGALTVRGALDAETAVSVSYDSRRSAADDRRLFGREIDPLDGGRAPTVGDGSERRVLAPAAGALAVKVERGYDWLEFGDVRPEGFAGDGRLFTYERSVTGVNGHVTTGDVTWQAFGSLTAQRLEQRQLRAMGGSGPFLLGAAIRPGTERVFIEVRARENAARVVDRRELKRVTDYEISYETGALLLRRPVPATDVSANPVFVVALVERRGAGDRSLVGGVRAELDLGRRLGFAGEDAFAVAASVVRDEAGIMPGALAGGTGAAPLDVAGSRLSLVGADARYRRDGVEARVEVIRSDVADSGSTAGRAALAWRSRDERFGVDASWMRVGQGFGSAADPRLSSAVDEVAVAGSVRLGDSSKAELAHRRERFAQYGVERTTTTARTEQVARGLTFSQEVGVARDAISMLDVASRASAAQGRLRVADGPDRSLFLEGTRVLSATGAAPQPDRLAAGATMSLFDLAVLEAKHEWVNPTAGDPYQSSGLLLRGASRFGRVWGGVDRASAARAHNSAVLGVEQSVRFARIWSADVGYERRMGIGAAPAADPMRGLPFAQAEPDYWTAQLGLSLLPGEDRPHATLQGELREARDLSSARVSLAADAPLGRDGAVLARSDWRTATPNAALAATVGGESRDERSVLGLALRPAETDLFDVLARLEWRRSLNPTGGALGGSGTTFADSTEHRRLIGSTDAVWGLGGDAEVALRYAVRWAERRDAAGGTGAPFAQFGGLRLERPLVGRLSARLDGRLLVEQSSGLARWSATPSALFRLTPSLHVEGGYRFGDLLDADFGTESTRRFFATLGVRVTERSLTSPASFWRDRLEVER